MTYGFQRHSVEAEGRWVQLVHPYKVQHPYKAAHRITVCTALGDNYTPHPTLYYHLSNSLAALAELQTAFLHEGLESAGEEQRAAMLGGTECACACRKGVRMSAELCGTYLQSSKRLTCNFLTKG